jgi:type II secretory pathway pseudopilin PulG
MRTGDALRQALPRHRGLTYLGLLLIVALLGASLAALGPLWSTAAQRERERELRFRGEQIAEAIGHYRAAVEPKTWPLALEDLVLDVRGGEPRHHLRRPWTDPFTGRADWVLLPAPPGPGGTVTGFAGVRSRSDALRWAGDAGTAPDGPPRVSDWRFTHDEPRPVPPASGASAATTRRERT